MTTKTQDEIESLKRAWKNDPCWDIEDTEGFGEHYEELKTYRLEAEAYWKQQRKAELFEETDRRATELKCSIELAEYTLILEHKIERLQKKLDELWDESRT